MLNRLVVLIVCSVVALSVLVSVGPTLVQIMDAAVPLVIASGLAIALLRIVWHYTGRY